MVLHAFLHIGRQPGKVKRRPPGAAPARLRPEARPVARPLVPVTLALMAGIAAPAWGLHLPQPWLLAGARVSGPSWRSSGGSGVRPVSCR